MKYYMILEGRCAYFFVLSEKTVVSVFFLFKFYLYEKVFIIGRTVYVRMTEK